MNLKLGTVAVGALVLFVAAHSARVGAGEPKSHPAHDWDYGSEHGPLHWGDLKADYESCKTGHHQSPVDIQDAKAADLPAIEFDYKPSPLRIIDNGHTVMASFDPGSSIRVGAATYQLQQLHFHHPSEDTIQGRSSDMEVHLVHADASGHLAVVAVLLERGKENRLVRELWKHIPKEKGKEARHEAVKIDAAELLPSSRGYYTFEGSLTTPPCSENVTWFVMKQPVPISSDEIARFSKLYPHNARPVQPVHDRVITATR